MCFTRLTETIEYYVSIKKSSICFINRCLAFDRVSHIKLFNTFQAHGVCPLIIRILYNMYTNSDIQVRWKSELSNALPLNNGVKQGCCLSPRLFTLYHGWIDPEAKSLWYRLSYWQSVLLSLWLCYLSWLLYHPLFLV